MKIPHESVLVLMFWCFFGAVAGCSDNNGTKCGNGIIDPGEICDGDCPSECDDDNVCTIDTLTGSAKTCDAVCGLLPITECADGDGCCPEDCNSINDSECPVKCGNGAKEEGETCDGDCPTDCGSPDVCTNVALNGSAENCDAECSYQEIAECQGGDGCCPEDCDYFSDNDCYLCDGAAEPESLQIDLPVDEGAHEEDLEWWYWTGHMQSEDGRWFGFEICFFLAAPGGVWAQVGHHAITDISNGSFHHMSNVGIGRPAEITTGGYYLNVPPLSAEGGPQRDVLHGEVDDYVLDLNLVSLKTEVFQHEGGYIDYPFGGNTHYYSRERLALEGTLKTSEEELEVTGSAWFDHQWGALGNVYSVGWDWFALQLDDDREIMIMLVAIEGNVILVDGSYTDANCNTVRLFPEDIDVTVLGEWSSPHTDCIYPSGWDIRVKEMNFTVIPFIEDQELYDLSPLIPYWEGASSVSGDATGRAYVELTGYCSSNR
jgi:predicted secreted hydrolase